jgi:RimJ/RimL family protein N-acetyltransferase
VGVTPDISLRKAQPEDAADLAVISRRAFHSDVEVGAPGPAGPPGYDDPGWQQEMMATGGYQAILVDGHLAGGALVFDLGSGHYELSRIFLDPQWHRQGVGRRAVRLVLAAHPRAGRWTLDTPVWNRRTRALYESLGFVETARRTEPGAPELVVYQRLREVASQPSTRGTPAASESPGRPA